MTRATLKLYPGTGSSSGFIVHRVTSNSWSETKTKWANAPAIGSQVAAVGAYPAGSYVSVDVTSLVTGSGAVSMALKQSSTPSSVFNSREAASNRPELVVESGPTSPPPPPSGTVVYAARRRRRRRHASRELADYIKAQNPDRFFYLGDVYETGTAAEFTNNYEPLYGSMAAKTDPVIGKHEYGNRATGYYPYWQGKRGWTEEQAKHRSYVDASGWQVIAYSRPTWWPRAPG